MPTDDDNVIPSFDSAPPPGEDDPYGAPTKVARVPDQLLDELLRGQPGRTDPTEEPPTAVAVAPAMAARAAAPSAAARPPKPVAAPSAPMRAAAPAPPAPRVPPAAPAPPPPPPDAGANDLSALADAASHAVMPRRPPPAPVKAPVAVDAAAMPASVRSADAAAYVPFGHDDGGVMELGSSPGHAPIVQSGRTVPLSAALLASVVKSVEDKRAAAGGSAAPEADVEPAPKKRSTLALVLILAIGLGVFITGVVMFLDAMK